MVCHRFGEGGHSLLSRSLRRMASVTQSPKNATIEIQPRTNAEMTTVATDYLEVPRLR